MNWKRRVTRDADVRDGERKRAIVEVYAFSEIQVLLKDVILPNQFNAF
jgi:hypothetical protein